VCVCVCVFFVSDYNLNGSFKSMVPLNDSLFEIDGVVYVERVSLPRI
jgi:hypothetical protein